MLQSLTCSELATRSLQRTKRDHGSDRVKVQAGVGFFDRRHGQTGAAPNSIELHPVLQIEVR